MNNRKGTISKPWLYGIAAAVVAVAALFSWLEGEGSWLTGWLAYSLLLGLGAAAVLAVIRITKARPGAQGAAWAAFGVRLLAGALLTLLLPIAGYQDNEATLHGYAFKDAYTRDSNSWLLAQSPDPLTDAFTGNYPGDQYGGLMFLSAAVYRYLSPDVHRQMLVLTLAAAASALGTLFLWAGVRRWFGGQVAVAAAWIFALYPEAVYLGSSQMREPFILAVVALALYSVTRAREGGLRWLGWMAAAGAVLLLMQPAGGLAALIVLSGLWFFDPNRHRSWKQPLILAGIILLALVIVISVWASLPSLQDTAPGQMLTQWLQNNFKLQSWFTIRGSGQVQKNLQSWGALILYGAARPVLPGALIEPAPVIWRVINTLRAAGWYLLAPFLFYSAWQALFAQQRRGQLIWLAVCSASWVLVASANGGADDWDNTRYRTLFLAFMALLAAWSVWQARQKQDPWLQRWLLVEGVFVLLFTQWYITRYFPGYMIHLSFQATVALCLLSAGIILGGGWLIDRKKQRQQRALKSRRKNRRSRPASSKGSSPFN